MSNLRTAAQQALAALMWHDETVRTRGDDEAIEALRAALEQQEQEPVAFMYVGIKHDGTTHGPHLIWEPEYMDAMSAEKGVRAVPLYTHPPRREWRGLTEEEAKDMAYKVDANGGSVIEFARAIEAALKERNA